MIRLHLSPVVISYASYTETASTKIVLRSSCYFAIIYWVFI